jgi:hypothetical protein
LTPFRFASIKKAKGFLAMNDGAVVHFPLPAVRLLAFVF